MAQQAAVLQGLSGGAAAAQAQAQGGAPDAQSQFDSSPPEPTLSEQMNARMMHLASGGGGAKMKLLRRDAPPPTSSASPDAAATPADRQEQEQKTAEQKQREYEERRAAIFGPTTAAATAPSPLLQTPLQPQQRVVKRDSGPRPSGTPPPAHSASLPSDSDPAVQATPAALAEVHAQHSKRTQQHAHNASRGKAGSHRIIEDLVGNRPQQPRSNTHSPHADPDFGRSSRRGQQQQQHGRRKHDGTGGPQQPPHAFSAYPAASPAYPYGAHQFAPGPVAVDMYGRPIAVGIAPGNAQSQQFAQGPQGNGIGFARGGQAAAAQQPVGLGGAPLAFNPGAQPFYPPSYPYPMQPQQPAPSAWPAPLSSPAELSPMIRLVAPNAPHTATSAAAATAPAYAQPNVFMGSGGMGRGASGGPEAAAHRR